MTLKIDLLNNLWDTNQTQSYYNYAAIVKKKKWSHIQKSEHQLNFALDFELGRSLIDLLCNQLNSHEKFHKGCSSLCNSVINVFSISNELHFLYSLVGNKSEMARKEVHDDMLI